MTRGNKQSVNLLIPEEDVENFIDEYLKKIFREDVIWYEHINQNLNLRITVEGYTSGGEFVTEYEDEWE